MAGSTKRKATPSRQKAKRLADFGALHRATGSKRDNVMMRPSSAKARDDVRLYLACCVTTDARAFDWNLSALTRSWLIEELGMDVNPTTVKRWMQVDPACKELWALWEGAEIGKLAAQWLKKATAELDAASDD